MSSFTVEATGHIALGTFPDLESARAVAVDYAQANRRPTRVSIAEDGVITHMFLVERDDAHLNKIG